MEKNIDLTKYGYTPVINDFNLMPARVTAVQRDRFELITEKGFTFGRLKSSIYYGNSKIEDVDYITREFPTVGDFVLIDYNEIETA